MAHKGKGKTIKVGTVKQVGVPTTLAGNKEPK